MTPAEARALMSSSAAADAAVNEQSGAPTNHDGQSGAGELGAGELPAELQTVEEQKAARLAALKAENIALLNMALQIMAPMLPFLPTIYTPAVLDNIATAGAAVELKHNISLGELFGKYKEEAMLAIAVVPCTVQAVVMTRAYLAEQKAARELDKNKDAAPSSSSSVSAPSNGTQTATG
jgi:hypothetical protein